MRDLESKLIFEIGYLSTEQQQDVLKLIEALADTDSLITPRIIFTNDNHNYLVRIKFATKTHSISFLTSPIKVMVEYLKVEHKLFVGEPTAQRVLEEIGSAVPLAQE